MGDCQEKYETIPSSDRLWVRKLKEKNERRSAGSASDESVISRLDPMPPNVVPVSNAAKVKKKRPRARR